jgi:8-oxo-dGTP diphosphatase/2-hydroxy-dATP diphosphatase
MKTKVFTLYIIHKNHKILLGYKKRGLGAEKYNGFGGKLNPPESITSCALRELLEECNILPIDGRFLALLVFNIFGEKWFVHLFKAQEF